MILILSGSVTSPYASSWSAFPEHLPGPKRSARFGEVRGGLFRDDALSKRGSQKSSGRPKGRPAFGLRDSIASVRNRRFRIGREGSVARRATQKVKRHLDRFVVALVWRHIGLRAGFLGAFGLEMAAQRGFALGIGLRLQVVGNVLQHLDIRRDALGLNRAPRRGVIARGGQAQRPIAGAERDDGLHRALAERARADQRRALVVLQRAGNDFRRRRRTAV